MYANSAPARIPLHRNTDPSGSTDCPTPKLGHRWGGATARSGVREGVVAYAFRCECHPDLDEMKVMVGKPGAEHALRCKLNTDPLLNATDEAEQGHQRLLAQLLRL